MTPAPTGAPADHNVGMEDSRPTDWFGYPIGRERRPVPCPHCTSTFTDREEYASHLVAEHGTRAPREPRREPEAAQRPALGRNPRSKLQRNLAAIPLVLVMAANVAFVGAVVGGLAALDPPWWEELRRQSWSSFLVVPLFWPTVAFLALRGIDT